MKLEINYTKKMKNPTNTWRLKNMLLNNQWINDQTKTDINQFMDTNDNNNTQPPLLRDAAKTALRGKYIAIHAYLKKEEQSQMNSLMSQLSKCGKRRTNEA